MTSALPSISPSIEVKYRVSLAPGAAFGESFICAKAGDKEAAVRPIRQSTSARMGSSLQENRDVLANPCANPKRRCAMTAAPLEKESDATVEMMPGEC